MELHGHSAVTVGPMNDPSPIRLLEAAPHKQPSQDLPPKGPQAAAQSQLCRAEAVFAVQPIQHVRLGAAGQLIADEGVEAAEKVARGGWRNVMSNPLMAELGVPVMHTWNYSVPIWNLHHHYQACLCRSQLELMQVFSARVLATAARPLKADELMTHAVDMP